MSTSSQQYRDGCSRSSKKGKCQLGHFTWAYWYHLTLWLDMDRSVGCLLIMGFDDDLLAHDPRFLPPLVPTLFMDTVWCAHVCKCRKSPWLHLHHHETQSTVCLWAGGMRSFISMTKIKAVPFTDTLFMYMQDSVCFYIILCVAAKWHPWRKQVCMLAVHLKVILFPQPCVHCWVCFVAMWMCPR